MSEENVTRHILSYLIKNNWEIIAYDFPQSGTGVIIQPNESKGRNNETIIPDIIAKKDDIIVFFENKDRIVLSDIVKIHNFIYGENYNVSIDKLMLKHNCNTKYGGIGLPANVKTDSLLNYKEQLDFILTVNEDKSINIFFDKSNLYTT